MSFTGTMFTKSASDGEYEVPPIGSYIFVMKGLVPDSRTVHAPKKEGDRESVTLQFQFEIADPSSDWDGEEVRSWFNEYFSDTSKTGLLFRAILNTETLPDNLQLEDLLDKPFRANLLHQVSKSNGKTYPKIDSPIAIQTSGGRRNRRGQTQPSGSPVQTEDLGEDANEPPF